MKKPIILIGAGGHCHSVIDVILMENKYEIAAIVDTPENMGKKVLNYKVSYGDEDLKDLIKQYGNVHITIGQIKSPDLRIKMFELVKSYGAILPIIQSPRAYVSEFSEIGEGSIVMHDVIVNANAKVGVNCILNTKSLIEHDAKIGDFCHISTAAVINGGSIIKEKSFIGSNSVVRDNISVPSKSVVRAGDFYNFSRGLDV